MIRSSFSKITTSLQHNKNLVASVVLHIFSLILYGVMLWNGLLASVPPSRAEKPITVLYWANVYNIPISLGILALLSFSFAVIYLTLFKKKIISSNDIYSRFLEALFLGYLFFQPIAFLMTGHPKHVDSIRHDGHTYHAFSQVYYYGGSNYGGGYSLATCDSLGIMCEITYMENWERCSSDTNSDRYCTRPELKIDSNGDIIFLEPRE